MVTKKVIFLFLLWVVSFLSGLSQTNGLIQIKTTKWNFINGEFKREENETLDNAIEIMNSVGNIIESHDYSHGEIIQLQKNYYNEKNQKIREEKRQKDGTLRSIRKFEYNTDNSLNEISNYNYTDTTNFTSIEKYYYKNGIQKKIICFNSKGEKTFFIKYKIIYKENKKTIITKSSRGSKCISYYDEQERLIKTVESIRNSEWESIFEWKNDNKFWSSKKIYSKGVLKSEIRKVVVK